MTAADFQRKWFDDPNAFRVFTDTSEHEETTGPELFYFGKPLTWRDAARDLARLSAEDRAAVSAQFPPLIWNSLPAVKGEH